MNYTLKIDLTKLDKDALFKSEKTGAIYLDAIIFVNDKEDNYGNNGAIVQSYPKDKKPEKPLYIGNVKNFEKQEVKNAEVETNDLPF